MFGLNPYFLIGIAVAIALSFGGGFTLGHKLEAAVFNQYKLEQTELARKQEQAHQAATDEIRKNKDEQIAAINSKLFDAISELRKRPSRPATITTPHFIHSICFMIMPPCLSLRVFGQI